ncbi:MAG TPA: hypothetical protein VGK81_06915, partial [Anaerolineae bacterium]
MHEANPTLRIVLGIPGPWHAMDELARAVAQSTSDFELRDGCLIRLADDKHFELELLERDPILRQYYALANRRSLSAEDLARIDTHASTAYLSGPGGSLESAQEMLHAGSALLQAGGYAVKVETAGIAHSARDWLAQTQRRATHVGALYIAYVALVSKAETVYSCGMQNMGFADALVSTSQSAAQAANLLRGFLMGVLHEQPTLLDGQSTVGDGDG